MFDTLSDCSEFVIFILQWVSRERVLHYLTFLIVHRVADGESPCPGYYTSAGLGHHLHLQVPQPDDHAGHPVLTQAVPDVAGGAVHAVHERLQH